jgi:hypothetical protein
MSSDVSIACEYLSKYDYMNNLKHLEQIKKMLEKFSKIVIYGNTTLSNILRSMLKNKVILVLDKNYQNYSMDNMVQSPESVINIEYDCIFISLIGREYEVTNYLMQDLSVDKEKIFTLTLIPEVAHMKTFFNYLENLEMYLSGKSNNLNIPLGGLISLFCKTQGYSSRALHNLITQYNKPYQLPDNVYGVLGNIDNNNLDDIMIQMNSNGYYIFQQKLSDEICDRLLEFALTTKAYLRPLTQEESATSKKDYNKRKKDIINRMNPEAVRYDYLADQLIQDEVVQKLLADISLIKVAQSYLECVPKSDVLGMWWHTAYEKTENAEAATMYHFDMDTIKWVKFFFYLTDVKKENGAHQFIKGTHNGNIPDSLMQRKYERIAEDELEKFNLIKDEVTYEARRGTIIMEDTSGLHRGYPVQNKDRLLFQIQFSDILLNPQDHRTKFSDVKIEKSLENMIACYPKVFEAYL